MKWSPGTRLNPKTDGRDHNPMTPTEPSGYLDVTPFWGLGTDLIPERTAQTGGPVPPSDLRSWGSGPGPPPG